MRVTAIVNLVTPDGEIRPGEELDIKDRAEAESLVARGFAVLVTQAARKPRGAAESRPDTESPTAESPPED